MSTTNPKGIVVFSGGSAANNLVDVFRTVRENKKCPLSYVIPISDNGGSSSELIRVFGGPGIGDVRSRLVRLIPDDPDHDDSEKAAIKVFFNHRLPKDKFEAKKEWLQIVDADHSLWDNFSSAKKELIRSFLNSVNFEIQKRVRPSSTFDFSGASIGNLFLTGARLFCGSFESAIYLLSSICSVPSHTSVVPAINTNFTHHISAGLTNGTVITGQNSISHPTAPSALEGATTSPNLPLTTTDGPLPGIIPTPSSEHEETEYHDKIEDANLPGTLPTLRKQNIHFSKSADEDLPARISRLWYINPYGAEIRLSANPRVISCLSSAQAVIYSIGSLYTSLIPSLILKGVGEQIANPGIKYKILILNSTIDRETGPSGDPFSALDFVGAIWKACLESRGLSIPSNTTDTYIVPSESAPQLDYHTYVTHLIHLSGPGTPVVDKEALRELGIETIRVYGRKVEGESFMRYDEKALVQALEVTMGRGEGKWKGEKVRRNTVEGFGGL